MTLFNAFVEQLTRTGGAVDAFYGPQVKADDEASFAAAARLVQAKVHAGRLLASAEIPVDVRRGEVAAEKIHVFCEKMAEITKPIFDSARAPYDKCRAGAARFPDAWWAAVCRTP